MHQEVGGQREEKKPQKRTIVHELTPVAALRAQRDRALLRQHEGNERGNEHQSCRNWKHKTKTRLGNFPASRMHNAGRLIKVEKPWEEKNKDEVADGAPHPHAAEGVPPFVAENCQADGSHERKHRRTD